MNIVGYNCNKTPSDAAAAIQGVKSEREHAMPAIKWKAIAMSGLA